VQAGGGGAGAGAVVAAAVGDAVAAGLWPWPGVDFGFGLCLPFEVGPADPLAVDDGLEHELGDVQVWATELGLPMLVVAM